MLVTQAKSILRLREKTGRSIGWCEARVRELATVRDGQRLKVREVQLDALIRETNNPTPITQPTGIRPLSERKIQRIKERCI